MYSSHSKIRPEHQERIAVIYLRQSSPQQVKNNRESTDLQYALAKLAEQYGWKPSQILILDEDLGKSGRFSDQLKAFQEMKELLNQGKVGAIFLTEASRATRSNAAWQYILEIAGFTDTLVIDTDGVYDLSDVNDQLVLGVKGTISQMERHNMIQRMTRARKNKAARGELRHYPAVGYKYNELGQLKFDPDEKVQEMIHFIHKKFREIGSVSGVVTYFNNKKILVPFKDRTSIHKIDWKPMTLTHAMNMLTNPVYAGVYVHGRSKATIVMKSGEPRKIRKRLPREEWEVFRKDSHPQYISLEEFLQNEQQIAQNSTRSTAPGHKGVAHKGVALLQGIVLCGVCGRRMNPHYKEGRDKKGVAYLCKPRWKADNSPAYCTRIPAEVVDKAVSKHVLELVNETELNFALVVLDNFEQELNYKKRQWEIKLEQAEDAVDKAKQKFDRASSEYPRVYAILNREWEDAMEQLEKIKQGHKQAQHEKQFELSDEQKQQILQLAQDIPYCWNSPTTTVQTRKEILRLLIKQVSLEWLEKPAQKIHIKILWHTEVVTEFIVERTKKTSPYKTPDFIIEEIRSLIKGKTDAEVADELNQRGLLSGSGKPFTKLSVMKIRNKYKISRRNAYKAAPHIIEEIQSLVISGSFDSEIADELNRRGFTTGVGKPFTASAIRRIRYTQNLPGNSKTTPDYVGEEIRSLMDKTDSEIANELNQRGFVSAAKKPFTEQIVVHIRRTHGLNKGNPCKIHGSIIEEIRSLIDDNTDAEIADSLNQKGFVNGVNKPFTKENINRIRQVYNLPKLLKQSSVSLIEEIQSLMDDNTDSEIANKLNQKGFVNQRNKPLSRGAVYQIRRRYNLLRENEHKHSHIALIQSLMDDNTDAEIADKLNQKGFITRLRNSYTAESVATLRHRHNLLRNRSNKTPDFIIKEVRHLMKRKTDAEIADDLNQRGFVSGAKQPFTKRIIQRIRREYNLLRTHEHNPKVTEVIQSLMSRTNSEIAEELNRRGFVRQGNKPFTQDAVSNIRFSYDLSRDQGREYSRVVDEIRFLMDHKTDAEIADELNERGFVNWLNEPFTRVTVAGIRQRYNLPKNKKTVN